MRTLVPILCLSFSLAVPAAAQAATYRPTRFDDPAPNGCLRLDCSLREAVIAASASAAADRIELNSGTYLLTRTVPPYDGVPETGALKVYGDLTIVGTGAASTTVMWKPTDSGHSVFSNNSTAGQQLQTRLTLIGQTVRRGRASCIFLQGSMSLTLDSTVIEECSFTYGSGGAASLGSGTLTLNRTVLRNNSAANGGALAVSGVDIVSTDTEISGNTASSSGGAVSTFGFDWLATVVWVAQGTVVRDNEAAQDGGAIAVRGQSMLDLSSPPGVKRLDLSGNLAGERGGAISISAPIGVPPASVIERVRIRGNIAATGGGIHAKVPLLITDTEIIDNIATQGDGGGIALEPSHVGGFQDLYRLSLHGNEAPSGGGGAIAAGCSFVRGFDLSIHDNHALGGRGQAIDVLGDGIFRHLSVLGDGTTSPVLVKRSSSDCPSHTAYLANSIIAGGCSAAIAGELASEGGNQYGPAAVNCPTLPGIDQHQSSNAVFGLAWANYGGGFKVLGWPAGSAVPQRNFGRAEHCSATDVRDFPRGESSCDAGAFEEQ